MCGPYRMVHIIWSTLLGLYAVDEMEIFIRRTSKYDVSHLVPILTLDTTGIDLLSEIKYDFKFRKILIFK